MDLSKLRLRVTQLPGLENLSRSELFSRSVAFSTNSDVTTASASSRMTHGPDGQCVVSVSQSCVVCVCVRF